MDSSHGFETSANTLITVHAWSGTDVPRKLAHVSKR